MKLLVLLSRIPYPLEKGDKLRAYHQLRCLSAKFEVHLCCLNDAGSVPGAEQALSPYCKSFTIIDLSRSSVYWNLLKALFTGKPFQVGYFYSGHARRKISELIREIQPDHIYCQLVRVAEYVKDVKIRKTIDYQDVFSKGYERQASMVPFYFRPVFKMEACRLKRYERRIFDVFDHHTIISLPDRKQVDHPKREEIQIVHNGVDFGFFKPSHAIKDVDILFTGNMNYLPNVTGVEFLVNEVLPIINNKLKGVRVMIAGSQPAKRVLALATEQVNVTGWVDDIRTAYGRSKIFVAPMQIGTGLQNKLLEAMAMKLPCITSSLANAALGAEHGKEILVCNSPEEYAGSIVSLLSDSGRSGEIARNGFDFVNRNYTWEKETEKLSQIISGTTDI
jgi:polysaccharide biosynthesis protein PslH